MLHRRTHPNLDVEGCFGCKVTSVNVGTVPGGAKAAGSKTYYDRDALESQIGNLEANAAYTREATSGYGALRWSKGQAYHKDATGDWSQLTASDMDKVMYGSTRRATVDD